MGIDDFMILIIGMQGFSRMQVARGTFKKEYLSCFAFWCTERRKWGQNQSNQEDM